MFKTLNLPESQFSLAQSLLYICKKPTGNIVVQSKPEIDFLLLDQQIEGLQDIQSKTCQQMVQFVDQHREQFVTINKKFTQIEGQIQSTQAILKNFIPRITDYKDKHYSSESKIQEYITKYQKRLLHNKFIGIAKQQALFLINFVKQFEHFINLNIEQLTHWHKYYIVRLLKKSQYLKNLFEHPMVKTANNQCNGIDNLLDNVIEQLQFYLSQQLSRLISKKQLYLDKNYSNYSLLQEIKIWYHYNNKLKYFYEAIQQTLLMRELPALENLLISNKQSLLSGKQQQIFTRFYQNLFSMLNNFPPQHPRDRLLKIVHKFLYKKQLNFQYSYVVPTFAISYSAYKSSLKNLNQANRYLRHQLQYRHNWKLALWAQLRIKSIMDRSSKDFGMNSQQPKNKVLSKWLDIVFKKGFMIPGVKAYMIRLAFMLTNKYSLHLQQFQYNASNLNDVISEASSVAQILSKKLSDGFQEELKKQGQQKSSFKTQQIQASTEKKIQQVILNINNTIKITMTNWVSKNIIFIITSCKNSLQNYKSFVMKTIGNKKQKMKGEVNKKQTVQKILDGYLKNNPELQKQSINLLHTIVWQNIRIYYDEQYARDIYNHAKNNLTTEQMKGVMEVLALQRKNLFSELPEKSGF